MPGLAVETSFDLIFIWLYYFYLVHIIYYFYLTKMNLFIYFYIPTKFMINKKKFSVVIYVSCHALIYLFSKMVFSIVSRNVTKTCHQPFWGLLVNSSLISQFWENVISFNILGNALTPSHCSYNNEKEVFVQESKSNFFIVLFFKFVFINFLL